MSEGTDDIEIETPVAEEATAAVEETPTETAETTEPEVEEPAPEVEEEEKKKRISGYDRMKRKNQYLQSEILRLQEQASKPAPEPDRPPKEEDFNGDWGKYIAATAAYEASKAIKDHLSAEKKVAQESRVAELRHERQQSLEDRAEEFKVKATDFDQVLEKFVNSGGKFSDAVRELVIDSDKGPEMSYHIAKNPQIAAKLNSLSPLQAAKEFARLEDTLSKPSKPTKAPPPVAAVKGGAGKAFDPHTTDDMDAFAAFLRKDLAKRQGR